jgi:hypothetical protein
MTAKAGSSIGQYWAEAGELRQLGLASGAQPTDR